MEEAEREDKERIEKSLVEMMYQQRKRGQSRGRTGRGKERDVVGHEHHGGGADRGVGAMESEELMGLVMASLRKKVVVLEDERWMFEVGGGRGGGGVGGGGGALGVGGVAGERVEMNSNRYN